MKVTITYHSGNLAFSNNSGEHEYILRQAIVWIEEGESKNLRDSNGNVVGRIEIEND